MNKKISILALFLILFAVGVGQAFAACTLNDPSTNTNNCMVGTSNVLTATCTARNITSLQIYYRETTTSAWGSVGFNATKNLTTYTLNFNTPSFTESATGQLNLTYAYNNTGNVSAALTSIEVDNTRPAIEVVETGTDSQGTYAIAECKATDTIDTALTYTHTLWSEQDTANNRSAGTIEDVIKALYTQEDLIGLGTFRAYCAVQDNCGNSSGAYTEFQNLNGKKNVNLNVIAKVVPSAVPQASSNKSNILIPLFVIIFLVLAVVAYLTLESKGKR